MPSEIREIMRGDDKTIASIIRSSLEEYNANKPGTVYFDSATDHLSDVFKARRSAYFVLQVDNEIAGGAGYFPTEDLPENTCELVKMYLSAKFRHKGYGKMLLSYCIDKAKADGYSNMYIETMPELKNAINLYQKMDFAFLPGPMGNSGHDGCDIWMFRSL